VGVTEGACLVGATPDIASRTDSALTLQSPPITNDTPPQSRKYPITCPQHKCNLRISRGDILKLLHHSKPDLHVGRRWEGRCC